MANYLALFFYKRKETRVKPIWRVNTEVVSGHSFKTKNKTDTNQYKAKLSSQLQVKDEKQQEAMSKLPQLPNSRIDEAIKKSFEQEPNRKSADA